jgi:hypothetical protein
MKGRGVYIIWLSDLEVQQQTRSIDPDEKLASLSQRINPVAGILRLQGE